MSRARKIQCAVLLLFATYFFITGACGKKEEGSGCSSSDIEQPNPHANMNPGDPTRLSSINSACDGSSDVNCKTKDEDPSVLLASDGRFLVSWMSNRAALNDDIYVMTSTDGVTWSSPHRVTTSDQADWYPTIIEHETPRGKFHISWMRQQTSAPFQRHVYFNSSADGVTWDPAQEVQVSSGAVNDYLPYLIAIGSNLHIYFDNITGRSTSGTRDLFHSQSTDGGATWSTPQEAVGVNSATENDTFPFIKKRPMSNSYMMTWIRYDGAQTGDGAYFHESTDLYFATTEDGLTWSAVWPATPGDSPDTSIDSIPSIYHSGVDEIFTWVKAVNNEGHIIEKTFVFPSDYPAGVTDTTTTVPGYSPRVIHTLKEKIFLRVWVADPSGTQNPVLYHQIFQR